MSAQSEIEVPTLGESVSEATVAKWFKQEGEAVAKDDLLVELETDKVTLEVNALAGGVLKKINAAEGDTVEVGQKLGIIDTDAEAPAPAENDNKEKQASAPTQEQPAATPSSGKQVTGAEGAGPAARKLLSETGVNPDKVEGTGKDGRITKGDVIKAVEQGAASSSETQSGEPREKRVKMTRLRQAIARRLKESQNTAAMLTTFNEVDMTNVMELRKKHNEEFQKQHGIKLGFMSLFTKAAIHALKELPAVNAEIDGDEIVYKNYYDVGIAVGTEQGLVVPVIRDADRRNFADIEKELGRLAKKARDGELSMAEMQGGSFTITNGGIYGSMLSTPIINPPQTGILGLHNIVKRPVVMPDGSIQARPIMYIALSYDHRLVDGREAVTFLVRIKQSIEDPERLLLGV